jgi:hypothetical protein
MQYWLLGFGPTCPAGWTSVNTALNPDDCYENGPMQWTFYGITNIADLGSMALMGAAQSGGEDTLIFTSNLTAMALSNDDSILGLAGNWTDAEFNVFGDCCDSNATFNDGANIAVTTSVDNGTLSPPQCVKESFTGETNSLTLSRSASTIPVAPEPRIQFVENGFPTPPPSCATSGGTADSVDAVYRWYLRTNGDHFYTENPTGELAPNDNYTFEGARFSLFPQGTPQTTALFRWYSPGNGHHFYTTDPAGEAAPAVGYHLEGTLGFIATGQISGAVPLFRWYLPSNGDHFYTTDPKGELAPVAGYHFEKIVGFVKPDP